jgi:hypothetical protein
MNKNIMMGDSSECFKNRSDIWIHQLRTFEKSIQKKSM